MKRKAPTAPAKFKLFVEIPVTLEARLRAEAIDQRRSRQAQLVRVLEERYGLAAEAVAESANHSDSRAA